MMIRDLLVRERNIFALSITELIISVGYQMWYPLLPIYLEEDLKASIPLIGTIYGVIAIPSMLSALMGGYLSDRIGRKKVIVISGFITTLLVLLFSFTPTLMGFFLLFSSHALFHGATHSASSALIAESPPHGKRGVAFSNFQFFSLGGRIAAPAMGGVLVGKVGFSTLFALSSLVLLVGLLPRLFFLKEERITSARSSRTRASVGGLSKPLLAYIACFAMFGFADDLIDTFIPLYSKNVLNMRVEDLGLLISARHLAMFSFVLPSGMLADRLGGKRCVAISWMLSPAVLLGFAHSGGGILSFLTYFMDGVGWAIRQPAMPSLLAGLSPRERYGTIFGLTYLMRKGAGVPSPVLGGLMWQVMGPISLFYGYFSLMLLAAIALHTFVPSSALAPTQSPR